MFLFLNYQLIDFYEIKFKNLNLKKVCLNKLDNLV